MLVAYLIQAKSDELNCDSFDSNEQRIRAPNSRIALEDIGSYLVLPVMPVQRYCSLGVFARKARISQMISK